MKGFWLGLLLGALPFVLIAATPQVNSRFDSENAVYTDITAIRQFVDAPYFAVRKDTPTPTNLVNGQLIFVNRNGVVSLFVEVDKATYSVTLTK